MPGHSPSVDLPLNDLVDGLAGDLTQTSELLSALWAAKISLGVVLCDPILVTLHETAGAPLVVAIQTRPTALTVDRDRAWLSQCAGSELPLTEQRAFYGRKGLPPLRDPADAFEERTRAVRFGTDTPQQCPEGG